MSDILTPLFEVVSKVAMIEELPFHFTVSTFINHQGNRVHKIAWWISRSVFSVDDTLARSDSLMDVTINSMFTDDLDEDLLNEWVVKLTEILNESNS